MFINLRNMSWHQRAFGLVVRFLIGLQEIASVILAMPPVSEIIKLFSAFLTIFYFSAELLHVFLLC